MNSLSSTPNDESSKKTTLYKAEREFYGFCPVEFVDNMYNAVDDYISDGVDALESALIKALNVNEDDKEKRAAILDGSQNFLLHVRKAFDKNFDKFEIYALRNVFPLPEEVLNSKEFKKKEEPEDEIQMEKDQEKKGKVDEEIEMDEEKLDKELEDLRARIYEVKHESICLKAHHAVLDRNMREVSQTLKKLEYMENVHEQAVVPLRKLSEQAGKLQHLVEKMEGLNKELENSKKQQVPKDKTIDDYEEITRLFMNHTSDIRHSSLENITKFSQLLNL